MGNNSQAWATNTTAGLNSSLVLHYTRWQGVFVLCWALTPHITLSYGGGVERTCEWWEKAGRKRNSNGTRKEQGLPVSIDQSPYVQACPTLLRVGYTGESHLYEVLRFVGFWNTGRDWPLRKREKKTKLRTVWNHDADVSRFETKWHLCSNQTKYELYYHQSQIIPYCVIIWNLIWPTEVFLIFSPIKLFQISSVCCDPRCYWAPLCWPGGNVNGFFSFFKIILLMYPENLLFEVDLHWFLQGITRQTVVHSLMGTPLTTCLL